MSQLSLGRHLTLSGALRRLSKKDMLQSSGRGGLPNDVVSEAGVVVSHLLPAH